MLLGGGCPLREPGLVWIVLGSSVALNAILSASLVFLQLSYHTPILLMTFRGPKVLEPRGFPRRVFKLGPAGRELLLPHSMTISADRPSIAPNRIFASIFAIVTSIFFVFPPAIPVESGTSMNWLWVIVVVAVVVLMLLVNWLIDGRKNYRAPENVEMLMDRAAQATVACWRTMRRRRADNSYGEKGQSACQKKRLRLG